MFKASRKDLEFRTFFIITFLTMILIGLFYFTVGGVMSKIAEFIFIPLLLVILTYFLTSQQTDNSSIYVSREINFFSTLNKAKIINSIEYGEIIKLLLATDRLTLSFSYANEIDNLHDLRTKEIITEMQFITRKVKLLQQLKTELVE